MIRNIYEVRRLNALALLHELWGGVRKDMARDVGIQGSYLTKILNPGAVEARRIERVIADRIERAAGKPENWLDREHEGISDNLAGQDSGTSRQKVQTKKHAHPTRGMVPIVSWVIAGSLAEIEDYFLPDDDYEWIETTENVDQHQAIALEVEGDSMFDADNPRSFPPGCIIVVKRPDLRQPKPGDFVVVRFENQKRATFKQLQYDGDRMVLKALNKHFPPIIVDEPASIVGVVTERIQRERY
jgi:SOS-response transcriptional repressor LexA